MIMTTTTTNPAEYLIAATFYRNAAGAVAVSLDGGETLVNQAGRQMPVDESVWAECDPCALSEKCEAAALVIASAMAAEAEYQAAKAAKAQAAKAAQAAADAAHRAAVKAYWESPEGKARAARELAESRAMFRALLAAMKAI
jgi:hypothetical protein